MCERHENCGSWLASDSGVTAGASLQFELPIQVQYQSKKPSDLYPVHHLIS
jgi:hypothetical protein